MAIAKINKKDNIQSSTRSDSVCT